MFSVRIFQKEGGSGAFFLFLGGIYFNRFFLRILKIILVPIVKFSTSKLSYR